MAEKRWPPRPSEATHISSNSEAIHLVGVSPCATHDEMCDAAAGD